MKPPAVCAQTVHALNPAQYDRLQIATSLLWNKRGLLGQEVDEEVRVLLGTPWSPLEVSLHAPVLELPGAEGEQVCQEVILFMSLQPKDDFDTFPYLPLQFSNRRHHG